MHQGQWWKIFVAAFEEPKSKGDGLRPIALPQRSIVVAAPDSISKASRRQKLAAGGARRRVRKQAAYHLEDSRRVRRF